MYFPVPLDAYEIHRSIWKSHFREGKWKFWEIRVLLIYSFSCFERAREQGKGQREL